MPSPAKGRWRGLGAAIAFETPAILWDIRVAPDARGRGVGVALFGMVQARAATRGCSQLKVETQNTNVAACRFYERQGCQLRAITHGAYPDFPDEIQMFWYKDLL